MTEEWRPVSGWPYEVSSLGRVRRTGAATGARVGLVLRLKRNVHGYDTVTLSRPGEQTRFAVHRLVCAAFHGEPPPGDFEAAHLNGVRDYNRPSNLRWCTPKDNHSHMLAHGTLLFGERANMAKFSDHAVEQMRALYRMGSTKASIRAHFGVSRSHLDSIIARRFRHHPPQGATP